MELKKMNRKMFFLELLPIENLNIEICYQDISKIIIGRS